MIIDYVKFAYNNFKQRKLRALLTILGIFIGIAAVVSLISLGQGLQETVSEQFEVMGIDKIMITPIGGYFGIGVEGTKLTNNDVDVVKKVRGVEQVSGMLYKVVRVEYKDELKYTWIMGVSTEPESIELLESMQSLEIAEGRNLQEGDGKKAVVGYMFPEAKFFKKAVKIRDTIEIEGQEFKVVGTLEQIGSTQDDSSVLIPLDVSRELLNEPYRVDMIMLKVQSGFNVNEVAEDIKDELRDYRNVDEGEEDFTVQTSEQMIKNLNLILNVVQIVLIGITAISLLVGGIGIANTMYTSVLERTREIGIMKAVGARNSDIMLIFLIESGLLGLVGGIIGVIFGLGISKSVEIIAAISGNSILKASLSPTLIVGALAFSFIVGSLSGLMPAKQAAELKPVDALRYE